MHNLESSHFTEDSTVLTYGATLAHDYVDFAKKVDPDNIKFSGKNGKLEIDKELARKFFNTVSDETNPPLEAEEFDAFLSGLEFGLTNLAENGRFKN